MASFIIFRCFNAIQKLLIHIFDYCGMNDSFLPLHIINIYMGKTNQSIFQPPSGIPKTMLLLSVVFVINGFVIGQSL